MNDNHPEPRAGFTPPFTATDFLFGAPPQRCWSTCC
jgi:hypothetical protein